MTENPWLDVPSVPPFVLPSDKDWVVNFNGKPGRKDKHRLQIDQILPEPFVGNPDAPVVLLSNNPGYGKAAEFKKTQSFMDRVRNNLCQGESKYPFFYLDPELGEVGKWWRSKLKKLVREFGDQGTQIVARSILNVVYSPYPSKKFAHGKLRLPSQDYGFDLVREAMKRKGVIVRMRKNEKWFEEVPELKDYRHLYQVKNWQSPSISPKNCPDFRKIVDAIKLAEAKSL